MRIRPRTSLVVLVVVSLLASACSSAGDDTPDDAADDPTTEGRSDPDAGDASDIRDLLARAGVATLDEPGGVATTALEVAPAPIEMWSWQVDNMQHEVAAGGGYLGSQLDALVDEVGGDLGGLPFSYLIAAWLSEAPTPTAEAAAALIGPQQWEQAPSIVYPTAVLTMFTADVAALLTPSAVEGQSSSEALELELIAAVGGVCSTLAGWVSDVIATLFEALKVDVDDDSAFGWLGDIWNAAVDLAETLVTVAIETLTAPVLAVITDALAVIGTLSMVGSLLKPWSVTIEPDQAEAAFAVGDQPDIENAFTIAVDTNLETPWPAVLVDCASAVGLTLPDPSSAAGSDIEWAVTGLPPLGDETRRDDIVGSGNSARLEFVTAREACGEGGEQAGIVSASASITSPFPDELQAMLTQLLTNQVPVEPFASMVAGIFSTLSEPVFEKLAELVQISGAGTTIVTYHSLDDPPPEDPVEPDVLADGRWEGLWFSFNATARGESRVLVPLALTVDGNVVRSASARLTDHSASVDDTGNGYAIITVDDRPLTLAGTPEALTLSGEVTYHYETYARSDLDLGVNEFERADSFSTTFEIEGATSVSAGVIGQGSGGEGSHVAGWWLVRDGDGIDDLAGIAVRVSAAVLDATDLPDRPGNSGAVPDSIDALDRAVTAVRDSLTGNCVTIDPLLQFAGSLRGRAARALDG